MLGFDEEMVKNAKNIALATAGRLSQWACFIVFWLALPPVVVSIFILMMLYSGMEESEEVYKSAVKRL